MAPRRARSAPLTETVLGGRVVRIESLEDRPWVQRVWLDDGRTVVRKGQRDDDGPAGFERERSMLRALAGNPVVPALLEEPDGWLVLEDLPPGRSLADSLLGADPDVARADVVAYATALGRLGAWGAGRRFDGRPRWLDWMAAGRARFLELVPGVERELDDVVALLDVDGFAHGDPCPDNVRITEDGTCRVFDFERSTRGSPAFDAAYLVAPFPSCWCFAPLPPSVVAEARAAYEAELSLDPRSIDAALVAFLVARIPALEKDDEGWGTGTWRSRFHVWTASVAAQSSFPGVAAGAALLHAALPAAVTPTYPAFVGWDG